ncbi:hypothetical protein GRG88_15575 [Listeria monocytogenes]|nr:hypothetical protein [Listeria monocytogenes]
MSNLKEFLQYRALDFKYTQKNQDIVEHMLSQEGEAPVPLRNVCAKLSVELAEEIDRMCAVLGISKRLFIERALGEALDMAKATLDEVNAFEFIEQQAESK